MQSPDVVTRELLNAIARLNGNLEKNNILLEMSNRLAKFGNLLISASLPSSPYSTQSLVVGTTYQLLVSNDTMPIMRVRLVNFDFAQNLWFNESESVSVTTGAIVQPLTFHDATILQGNKLYGITGIATINIGILRLHDAQGELTQLPEFSEHNV